MQKVAAIWARVSTKDQTSLPDQVARAKEKLAGKGYIVPKERILATDWTSPELFNCPDFQRLRQWVKAREIQAIGLLDRDRLEARGLQRLIFLSECKEAGVELVICQGPPLLDEPEGQLVELALAIGKERSVMRAKLGAKDGMADKVRRDHKPTSKHRIFGYKWVSDCRLEPDYPGYDTVKMIFDLALTGATDFTVQKELMRAGKLTAKGLPEWDDRSSISFVIHNPVYAGRYYALKRLVAEPKKRVGNTYGNSSARNVPLNEAVYLSEVEIINPPITWEQREQILKRREVNRKLSKRNGKLHDYLLRGFIKCYTHYGKKGEPRTYFGHPSNGTFYYQCPVGGCAHPNLNGPRIEERVKGHTRWLLNLQPEEFYKQIGNQGNIDQTRESLEKELRSLDAKYNRNISAETELENRDLLGQVHPEVYRRLKSSYQAERLWIEERRESIEGQLQQLQKQADIASIWWQLKDRVSGRLDQLTGAEWREIWITLNLEVNVRDRHNPETWRDGWHPDAWQDGSYFDENRLLRGQDGIVLTSTPMGADREEHPDIEICYGLPVKVDVEQANRISEIVFTRACPSPSS
jgi:hypothetical protein